MVTVSKCTIQDLATIMKDLGAYNAMNLDGGASTSLYANGKFWQHLPERLAMLLWYCQDRSLAITMAPK